ncbi:hypothetical protein Bun01g_22530 [Bacteroides uniformis]|uniref:Phage gp6-like head-tail connector protein n=1 Tax=Bacteroides uniformis TaxID=820 RepID=A0A4Y1VG65_BACUN|nr:head-tail connector protein [Bacteroides uniformis]BBK87883.1 hypothetical protein Bun01g_22530 [Bacteroides uniformis]
MKEYITLEEIKKHLNIDFSDDDTYLADIVTVAQMSVERAINAPLSEHEENGALNPMLKHAIKILAGNFYANREPVSFSSVSFVTYSVFYFYGVNVLRNWKLLCRTGSTMYKCVSFLYYVVSVEFIKSVPFLSNYYQKGTKCENINQ